MEGSNSQSTNYCINFQNVQEAAKRIQNLAHETPILTSSSIDSLLQCENKEMKLFFKVEALQKTGSFKFRGALNATKALQESVLADETTTNSSIHVVTHSSGNHAQALALSARMGSLSSTNNIHNSSQIQATIVMPRSAPTIKQNAVRSYGAKVILCDNTNEARKQKTSQIMQEYRSHFPSTKTAFIHPSEDPLVIAGQGTVSLEMISQVSKMTNNIASLDIVVIPVGGGGLASGNTITLRALLGPKVKIILAEPETLNDAKRSKESGQLLLHDPQNPLQSVADGLKTTLGPNTWPIVRDLVDDIITVSELDILKATKLIWERLKIGIEPSAGVGVAVVLGDEFAEKYGKLQSHNNNVGVILCGGNVDFIKVTKLMQEMDL